MTRHSLTILLLLFVHFFNGQEQYQLDTIYTHHQKKTQTQVENLNQVFEEKIYPKYKGKTLKILKKKFKFLNEDFTEKLNEKDFIFDKRLTSITDKILTELKSKNPIVPKNTILLISKNPSLNAYCLPNGVFILNIGTFDYLENEDQIAGVIAHEISHKILEHSVNFTIKMVKDEIASKENKVVKNLKKKKYNTSKKAFALFKNKMYATGGFKRKNEFEADSLAYILLKPTQYNPKALIRTFEIMEKYDSIQPKGVKMETLKKYFTTPTQPFKEEWLKQEDFSVFNYGLHKEKLKKDKIATHPKSKDRIIKLKNISSDLEISKTNKTNTSISFENAKKISHYNIVSNLIFYEKYDVALYFTLKKLEQNKNSKKYKKHIAEIFKLLYKARKEYKLNRYVSQVNHKKHTKGYAQFLSFIWNLSLEDIKNISDFYNQ